MNEIKVLEVYRSNGSRLWLYRRHGAVLRLAMNVLGVDYHVHVVATIVTDAPVARLMPKIPVNWPNPARKRRKPRPKIARNQRTTGGVRA